MQSFSKYVEEKQDVLSLFGDANFFFQNSRNDVLIQLADLISGTLARIYDEHKKTDKTPNYIKTLQKKLIRIELYPKTYETYNVSTNALAEDYEKDIAELCLKQAIMFIKKYENDDDTDRKAQIITLQYMLFRFMNNDLRKYIPTRELMNQLENTEFGKNSIQTFRQGF
jgi:hypothetical protein